MMERLAQDLKALTDEQLVEAARAGDSDSLALLMERCIYPPSLYAKLVPGSGLEYDDMYQEAVIALLKAVRTYDPVKAAGFRTYSGVCIRRRLISAVRSSLRQKHLPMVEYLSLGDLPEDGRPDPETLWIRREETQLAQTRLLRLLSDFEREMLLLYLNGFSYEEMAQKTGKTPKAVGNALQRGRQKLRSEWPLLVSGSK